MPWREVKPIVEPSVRKLCIGVYPNHPKGCPNYGEKQGCPPQAPLIGETIDLSQTVFAVWNVFPFGEHVAKMKAKHPDWSERQLACCFYWQGKARKQLKGIIADFFTEVFLPRGRDGYRLQCVIRCPEGQGVNLTATMKSIGIELEWPPETVAYQIVLVGRFRGKTTHKV